jgi:hypothetical protein
MATKEAIMPNENKKGLLIGLLALVTAGAAFLLLKGKAQASSSMITVNGIAYAGSQPPFTAGEEISCTLTVTNPTTEDYTYVIELSLGSVVIGTFPALTIPAGETATTDILSGLAPDAPGTYAVNIDVTVSGQQLSLQAGNVVVNAAPAAQPELTVVSLTWQ